MATPKTTATEPEPTPAEETPTAPDAPVNKSYKCLGWLSHDNVTYSPGSMVELPDNLAALLAGYGVIELPGI